jgi:RNA polymerase sigma-70 factor (ECF subfamily)
MNAEQRTELNTLIRRYADGERPAFGPLFDRLWPALLAFTTRTLASRADGEDAAQQAILKVFSRIVDFDRARDGLSWALAIAACEVMTIRKQRARRREGGEVPLTTAAEAPSQEESAMRAELRAALQEVLGGLSPQDQQALAYVFGDAAPATDETGRKRRFRALERLRAAWRRAHG